jgi:glycosyltransferase involved in cell wall biosynthesis
MKVCMVAYTFYESDNRVRRYAETLAKRGDEVEAIVLRRDKQSREGMVEGVRVRRIQTRVRDEKGPLTYLVKLLIFLFRSMWVLTVSHLKSRYDLIHVHSVPDFEVFAALIPRLMGAKVILDIHDIVPELYASKFRIRQNTWIFGALVLMEKLSVCFANHVIIANHLWHERLVQRSCRPERCSTILNYPDLAIFRLRHRPAGGDGSFTMFYPGTLSWHQGVDLIISAMGALGDDAKHMKLLVVGDGAERERLQSLAQECGLTEQVVIRGPAPLSEVADIMARVDLGVEPKRKRSFANEALSTKILEFMALGVPVLASDTRVHEMYFSSKVEFFESENVEELAARILALSRDGEKREALRMTGFAYVAENNWDLKRHEYLDLVDRLTRHRSELVGLPAGGDGH